MRNWGFVVLMVPLVVSAKTSFAHPGSGSPAAGSCPKGTLTDWVLGFPHSSSPHRSESTVDAAVIQGGEISLQKALYMVHSKRCGYVAILFYASWCPFSRGFEPSFSTFASLYPSIPHIAIEETAIRPSILSKYGVHGFPTLFLLNATMRIRYGGLRSFNSLSSFYSDVTGIKSDGLHRVSLNDTECPLKQTKGMDIEQENCPFSWARSPENLFHQETYLALATSFVLLRGMYLICPYLVEFARSAQRRRFQNARIRILWEHLLQCLFQVSHSMNCLRNLYKRRHSVLHARTWAS